MDEDDFITEAEIAKLLRPIACSSCVYGIRSDRAELGWECAKWEAQQCRPLSDALKREALPEMPEITLPHLSQGKCEGCGGLVVRAVGKRGAHNKRFCSVACGKRQRDAGRPSGGARRKLARLKAG